MSVKTEALVAAIFAVSFGGATQSAAASTAIDVAQQIAKSPANNTNLHDGMSTKRGATTVSVDDLAAARLLQEQLQAKVHAVALEEIDEFCTLSEGWDDGSAAKISNVAIESAKRFLHFYSGVHLFTAFPDADGTVGLQAELRKGRILLSFEDNGTIAYFIRKDGAVHRGDGVAFDAVDAALKHFA